MKRVNLKWWMVVSITAVAIISLIAAGCSAPKPATAEPYKIGLVSPLTGYLAALGNDFTNGAKLAIKDINAAGGVNGHQLQLIVEDDKSDPVTAVSAVSKLIKEDQVLVVANSSPAQGTLAIKAVTDREKVPFYPGTILAKEARGTPEKEYWTFQTYYPSEEEAKKIVDDLSKFVSGKKIGIIADNAVYGTELAQAVKAYAPTKGYTVVAEETFKTGDADVTPQLTRIMNNKPDLIISTGTTTGPAITAKGMVQLGINLPMFSGRATLAGPMVTMGGKFAEQYVKWVIEPVAVFDTLPDSLPYKARLVKYAADFKAEYGKLWDFAGAERAYDTIKLISIALSNAGSSPTRVSVRDAAEKVSYDGLTCQFNFTPAQHYGAVTRLVWTTIKDGKQVFVQD